MKRRHIVPLFTYIIAKIQKKLFCAILTLFFLFCASILDIFVGLPANKRGLVCKQMSPRLLINERSLIRSDCCFSIQMLKRLLRNG